MKEKDKMTSRNNEITSFNKELLNFDVDDVSVEELEQRLELAIATPPDICGTNTCTKNCFDCGTNSCSTNCTP